VAPKPEFLKALQVVDIFSVSACISEDFADYRIQYWKHNGYWLFDSPEIIRKLATERAIPLDGTSLFFYEAYEWNSMVSRGTHSLLSVRWKRVSLRHLGRGWKVSIS
jgi:hypothetical protein